MTAMGSTMRRLILLRHTKSDWPAGMVDFERPLAARGRRAAPLMGRLLIDRGLVPDRVVVSPAARTVETWALASAGLVQLPPGEQDGRIYEAPAYELANVIRETPDEVGTLLLVGHNPASRRSARSSSPMGRPTSAGASRANIPPAGSR
jgi:phosphohistidine phosphatase